MRAVVQRVRGCTVTVDNHKVGAIGDGLLVYLGVAPDDSDDDIEYTASKIINLRVFADADGKMNLSAADIGAEVLVVSQFTLYGDTRKGRRPSYTGAAPPEMAEKVVEEVVERVSAAGLRTAAGKFGALMDVQYTNHGPVTILIDSRKTF